MNAHKRRWAGTVCSTENGGRSWRTIFRGGNYIFAAVRTSARAGVVSTGAHGHAEWWTRDNGRRWFQTDVIGGDQALGAAASQIAGRGSHLYWGNAYAGASDTIYRVTPWPPTAAAVCSGQWAWASARAETADPAGNHCQGGIVNAGMTSAPIATVSGHVLQLIAAMPSGFVPTFVCGPAAPGRPNTIAAVVHRRGATVRRTLPTSRRLDGGVYRVLRIVVAWPTLTIRGDWTRIDATRPSSGARMALAGRRP